MAGISSDLFTPDAVFTQAQAIQILYALEGYPTLSSSVEFADVAPGDWFASAVNCAAANGVVSGVDDAHFAPNSPLTREQLALILYRCPQAQGV